MYHNTQTSNMTGFGMSVPTQPAHMRQLHVPPPPTFDYSQCLRTFSLLQAQQRAQQQTAMFQPQQVFGRSGFQPQAQFDPAACARALRQ